MARNFIGVLLSGSGKDTSEPKADLASSGDPTIRSTTHWIQVQYEDPGFMKCAVWF